MANMAEISDAKAVRREYYREWRKKNPEKVRAINERYWTKKAIEIVRKLESEGN